MLAGCAPAASTQILTELDYKNPIKLRSNKHLSLSWRFRNAIGARRMPLAQPGTTPGIPGAGVAGAVVSAVGHLVAYSVVAKYNQHISSQGRYEFDEQRAEIFIHSLKKILEKHQVFSRVRLVNSQKLAKSSFPRMLITFKSTLVKGDYPATEIVLDVELNYYVSPKVKYHKIFFIESGKPTHLLQGNVFLRQQQKVANLLMKKIITSLEKWQH